MSGTLHCVCNSTSEGKRTKMERTRSQITPNVTKITVASFLVVQEPYFSKIPGYDFRDMPITKLHLHRKSPLRVLGVKFSSVFPSENITVWIKPQETKTKLSSRSLCLPLSGRETMEHSTETPKHAEMKEIFSNQRILTVQIVVITVVLFYRKS